MLWRALAVVIGVQVIAAASSHGMIVPQPVAPACEVEVSRCAPPAAAVSGSAAVTYLPAARVDAAFTRGEPLLELENYKIHASRREGPGLAEIHTRDTDIVHVLQGSALLVTGGRVVDAKQTANEELRGSSIVEGMEQRIGPGDVVIIPSGVPHWFREVKAPLLYYVVKVRDENERTGRDAA